MNAVKKLRKIGNSVGLILPNDILEQAGFTDKSEVNIRSESGCIHIELSEGRKELIVKAAAKYVKKYSKDLAKLAK